MDSSLVGEGMTESEGPSKVGATFVGAAERGALVYLS